jgi:hypothetical protein
MKGSMQVSLLAICVFCEHQILGCLRPTILQTLFHYIRFDMNIDIQAHFSRAQAAAG